MIAEIVDKVIGTNYLLEYSSVSYIVNFYNSKSICRFIIIY